MTPDGGAAGAASPALAALVLAGAGKMGGAMLEGWLATGLDPRTTVVLDPHASPHLTDLAGRHGFTLNPPSGSIVPPATLVLGIKPQTLETAAADLAPLAGPDTLVLSVLAGKTVADIRRALPRARAVIRAMPNLPAAIGRGATGAFASPEVEAAQRDRAASLLQAVGIVEWVETEALVDAVTAVSGSGPAYVFHLCECLAAAGEAAGLARDVAARLARATVSGAGALLDGQEADPAELRRNVTSPGGTTAAALDVLMAPDGLAPLMARAVAAAKRRAGELSG